MPLPQAKIPLSQPLIIIKPPQDPGWSHMLQNVPSQMSPEYWRDVSLALSTGGESKLWYF